MLLEKKGAHSSIGNWGSTETMRQKEAATVPRPKNLSYQVVIGCLMMINGLHLRLRGRKTTDWEWERISLQLQ